MMWEYKIIDTSKVDLLGPGDAYSDCLAAGLNQQGQDGWELAAVTGTLFIFKREMP